MLATKQHSSSLSTQCEDYHVVEHAIAWLEDHLHEQPELAELALAAGYSPDHFQRVFTRWAGISPKRFLQAATLAEAKRLLSQQRPVLEIAHEIGLSGGSRLHDLLLTCEAVTPGQMQKQGEGLTLRWGMHPTPFGEALFARTEKGLSDLYFTVSRDEARDWLQARWPKARITEDAKATQADAAVIFAPLSQPAPLALHLKGTNFQLQVWRALLSIPEGGLVSYSDVAKAIGHPKAVRAVGTAVGSNPISYLIPCHRVLRESGAIGGYGGGTPRKRAMLAKECPAIG